MGDLRPACTSTKMTVDQFLVTYGVRAPQLMWLLGAGASAAGGIPTAYNLIWKFKQTLFCASQRISKKSVEDLSDPLIQRRLQRHFDSLGSFPAENSPSEYAEYFLAAHPYPGDRRTVIDQYVRSGSPSYGHRALAALLAIGRCKIIWTTNFDKLAEDAAIRMLGSSSQLVIASLDNALTGRDAFNSDRWPLVCKLHGDFQSSRLKNTLEELGEQDADLRRLLVDACKRFGLIVMGYSGRDESVMHALNDAIDEGRGYPAGLFWFHRPDGPVLNSVSALIKNAQKAGIQAYLVEAQTFDEVLGDVIRQEEALPIAISAKLDEHRSIVSDVPVPEAGGGWPVVRLNALPVSRHPSLCRLIECSIGNTKEVKDALAKSGINAVGVRHKKGVLAFGDDNDLRKAFGPFGITRFDTHSIEPKKLHYDSSELGLLRDVLAIALNQDRPLRVQRKRASDLCLLDWARVASSYEVAELKRVTGQIRGTVPSTDILWEEALHIKLSYHLNRMWLLIEPTIRTHLPEDIDHLVQDHAKKFVQQRLAGRYNRTWNALLDAWSLIIAGPDLDISLHAFTTDEGPSTVFSIQRTTGFSRRAYSR